MRSAGEKALGSIRLAILDNLIHSATLPREWPREQKTERDTHLAQRITREINDHFLYQKVVLDSSQLYRSKKHHYKL